MAAGARDHLGADKRRAEGGGGSPGAEEGNGMRAHVIEPDGLEGRRGGGQQAGGGHHGGAEAAEHCARGDLLADAANIGQRLGKVLHVPAVPLRCKGYTSPGALQATLKGLQLLRFPGSTPASENVTGAVRGPRTAPPAPAVTSRHQHVMGKILENSTARRPWHARNRAATL